MAQNACDPTVERHFKGHKKGLTAVCFHPGTQQIASSSLDHTLMVWNFNETVRAFRFLAHKDVVLDTTYAPSGEIVVSASRDRSVRLWIPTVRGESLDFRGHMGAVRSVKFSPDGEKVKKIIKNLTNFYYLFQMKFNFYPITCENLIKGKNLSYFCYILDHCLREN